MRSVIILSLSSLLLLSGCQTENQPGSLDPTLNGFFAEDTGDPRKHNQFADAMAASGARADATLSRHHFDGPSLNSLGQDKLALMLMDDDQPNPVKVYLNFDDNQPVSTQRQTAVVAFLKDKGLSDAQLDVTYGVNPANWTPAAQHLKNLDKTDTGTTGGVSDVAGATDGGESSKSGGGRADSSLAGSSGPK